MIHTWQVDEFDRCNVDQFFRINDDRVGSQRYGATGVAGAAPTWNDGQAEFDTVAHQWADFGFGIRIEHHKWVLDAPVGGIGHVRYAGQTIKGNIVFTGVLGQCPQYLAPAGRGAFQMFGKTIDGFGSGLEQLGNFIVTVTTFFDFGHAMAQCRDQRGLALRILQQVVF